MTKQVTRQNKKNLRQRANRLHLSANSHSKYGIGIEFVGSLAKGQGEVEKAPNGQFDLDVNFLVKSKDHPKDIYKDVLESIKKSLRSHERIEQKNRVIRVIVSKDGNIYNFDIAIKDISTNKIIVNNNGELTWKI